MTTKDVMTFEEALDQVINYLGDEYDHYHYECSTRERRNHIWRAVEVIDAPPWRARDPRLIAV